MSSGNKIVKRDEKFDSSKFYIEHGIDLEERRIMIDTDIDEFSIGYVCRAIHKMVDQSPEAPIDIVISSYGGCVYDALALYDLLRSLDYLEVRTHATGKVMSAGFIIFLAGDKRTASPRVRFMMHSLSSGVAGKLFEMITEVDECKALQKEIFKILQDRTEKSETWWRKELKYEDRFYSREEAITIGVVTEEVEDES